MNELSEHDPHETLWRAVDDLEMKGFTYEEIMRAMADVYGEIPRDTREDE